MACHTIAFNPPPGSEGDFVADPEGSVRINPAAFTPAQAPPPPPLLFDPAAGPVTFDAGG